MKKIILSIVAAVIMVCCNNNPAAEAAVSKTEVINGISTSTFKVWGNCEMCKKTIEGSLNVNGISKADWSPETKIINISYDTTKISLDQIKQNIASVGYDTEEYKGNDKAYSELPGCCQYDRK